MRTRRRLIAAAAAAALVIAACGTGDDEPAEGDATTGDADTEATEEPTEPATDGATDGTAAPADGELTTVANEAGCAEDYSGKVESIEATDTHEVVFNLCSPDPAFLEKMAFVVFGIQPSEHLEATGGAPLDNPIGTGPFVLDEWNRGSELTFSRNEDYWGDAPAFDTLVMRWAEESTQRLTELQSGTAQYATNMAEPDYELVEGDDNLSLLTKSTPNILYLGFSNTIEPFDNPDVRRAIAMGIDRQRIVDSFYPAGTEVAGYFTPCAIESGCTGDPWYDYDPEAARQLLADAGFPDGFDTKLSLRDVFRDYLPEPQTIAQEFQTQLADNLNINAEIDVQESGAFLESSSAGDEPLYLLGWNGDYAHPTNFLDFHFGGNLQFGDPITELVDTLNEAAGIADPAEAAPLYEQANNIIREEVPMVPISHAAAADAAVAGLGNAQAPVFGSPHFKSMEPDGDTLVVVKNAEPISLYCADESDGESLDACSQVLEGLYSFGLDGGAVPALAEECAPNDDLSVWTCSLREGVTFHDGSDFESSDVIATWAAGIDAGNPNHVGNTGAFDYYSYLWGSLVNPPPPEEE